MNGSDDTVPVAGCRVQVAGLGDLGAVLRPDQVVHAALELLRFYIHRADRSERETARVGAFFAAWGKEACLAALESSLGSKLTRHPPPPSQPDSDHAREKAAWADLRDHGLAAWPQQQAGLWAVGIASPPAGWLSAQWEELAHLADLFGSGRLRLTTRQAVLIPGVLQVSALEEKLRESGLPCCPAQGTRAEQEEL